MKPSKTTKNNQSKNLIDPSKVFILGFWVQVGIQFRMRDANLKTLKTLKKLEDTEAWFCHTI